LGTRSIPEAWGPPLEGKSKCLDDAPKEIVERMVAKMDWSVHDAKSTADNTVPPSPE